MRKICFLIIGTLTILLATSGCNKDDTLPKSESATDHVLKGTQHEGKIKLGKKLENPYSVKNMKKAYEKLKEDGRLKSSMINLDSITASHLYVRFLPQDSLENDLLLNDPALELYSYPLDYEILESGSYYHDPDIPEDQPTWLYTTVPIGQPIPQINCQILAECFIPDHNASLKSANAAQSLADLEFTAYCVTGNENQVTTIQTIINSGGSASSALKTPTGTMSVWHSTAQYLSDGIAKVKVRANTFVKIGIGWTDTNGSYTVDKSFLNDMAHYSLVYTNSNDFTIWGNFAFFAPAMYEMHQQPTTGYSVTIGTNSVAWLWSMINNAACDYYDYCSDLQIPGPPSDLRIWNMRVGGGWGGSAPMTHHISLNTNYLMNFLAATYATVGYQVWTIALSLIMPDVFILLNDGYTSRQGVYETVFHELGHTSHYQQVGDTFWQNYVLHIIANGGYGDGSETLAGYCGVGEMWGNFFGYDLGLHKFGGTFTEEQKHYNWYKPGFLMDLHDLAGFTDAEIFSCLTSGVHSIPALRNELISKFPLKTNQINSHYGHYFQ